MPNLFILKGWTRKYFIYTCYGVWCIHGCYNIAIDKGGMTNEVFLLAFHETDYVADRMYPGVFCREKLATMKAFRLVNREDPFVTR